MIRKLLVASAAIAALSLTACGKPAEKAEEPTAAAPAAAPAAEPAPAAAAEEQKAP
jgi:predicted outer membrane protein